MITLIRLPNCIYIATSAVNHICVVLYSDAPVFNFSDKLSVFCFAYHCRPQKHAAIGRSGVTWCRIYHCGLP